jgi:transcriptional regulator with XRE-family HTH domain
MPRKKFPANVVGPQVRRRRYEKRYSQEALAARCQLAGLDISRSTLAQIEIRFRYVSDEELFILAKVLHVAPNDLYPAEMRKQFPGGSRRKSLKYSH